MAHCGRRTVILVTVALCLSMSLLWCIASISDMEHIMLVPSGDVAYGLRSYAGRLEWVKYVPWGHGRYLVQWSVPWWLVIGVEVGLLGGVGWRGMSSRSVRNS